MKNNKRKILVTCALPYANGSIHLGHMVEHVQGDIWVRAMRMRGHQCHFVCADDAHGTPIMISAQKRGISADALIAESRVEHQADLADFCISYDNYSSTHVDRNRLFVEEIFGKMQEKGLIEVRQIKQFYDEEQKMFLPDRFIKGNCPNCGTLDQYGDVCESCHKTYGPTDLVNPYSVVSGKPPVLRDSDHYFVKLSSLQGFLSQWVRGGQLQDEVVNKLEEWFTDGLRDWDISRDTPYFGFRIPGETDKYFYVWVDAPIGYMTSFHELCQREGIDFDEFWRPGSETELYHFIGKDIIYFHTLFWPAMLHAADYRLPTSVFVHGFLTVNGKKMSKSRGTFILARTYLDHLEPDYIRYYFASKLGSALVDIDLNLDDFQARVNADLVGKVINIASRCAGFINKRFDGRLSAALPAVDLFQQLAEAGDAIAADFEAREYNRAMRRIMALADAANRYIDERKPWQMIKEVGREAEVQQVCTLGINLFRSLMVYLKPVIPTTAERAEAFLNVAPLCWDDVNTALLDHPIKPFKPLMTRIDEKQVEAIIKASKQALESNDPVIAVGELADSPIGAEISFEDFAKIDLRVARIVAAEFVEGADQLLAIKLDLDGVQKQVFAGIKSAYDPKLLVGRMTVMVANIKPRKMRFGVSEGMLLAAGPGNKDIFLLTPDEGAKAGMRVK